MICFKDKALFDKYKSDLLKCIEKNDDSYVTFMKNNENPFNYLKKFNIKSTVNTDPLGLPYYDEIDINEITDINADAILDDNFTRVIDSIKYILVNQCKPLSLIKDREGYYLKDGKHRYFAHLLLGKEKIPASIRKFTKNETKSDMITISKPYPCELAYPEKAWEFFELYRSLFNNVMKITMLEDRMEIQLKNNDIITFNGCCLAGSNNRAAEVACHIIAECGYKVNMEYIEKHKTFILEDRDDAHNMNFNSPNDIDTIKIINSNLILKKDWFIKKDEVAKIHNFISDYKPFNTNRTYMDVNSTSILEIGDKFYYLIVSEDNKSKRNVLYIIEGDINFNSLNLKYIGKFLEGSEMYKKLIE